MEKYVESVEQLVNEIFVRDIEASTKFYVDIGFKLIRQDHGFCEFEWEDHKLYLDERKQLRDIPVPNFPAANVRIMVKDVDAVWNKLHTTYGKNLKVFSEIKDQYYGLRDFTILDLDGFGLRFASNLPSK